MSKSLANNALKDMLALTNKILPCFYQHPVWFVLIKVAIILGNALLMLKFFLETAIQSDQPDRQSS